MTNLTNEQKKEAFKTWLKHAIESEYYSNSMTKQFEGLIDNLFDDIDALFEDVKFVSTKSVYNELSKKITQLITEFEESISETFDNNVSEIAKAESKWLNDFSTLFSLGYVIPKTIESQMRFIPVGSNESFEKISENTANRIKNNIDTVVKSAYFTKTSVEELKKSINAKKERVKKNLQTDTETFSTAMFRATQSITLKNSAKYVIYLAHLDSRTCLICADNHLQRFKVENAPLVPVHEHCRCSLIDEALFSDDSPKTYEEYLEELDDEELIEILGKSRYKMYKAGVPVTSFVNNGKILTLKELSEIYD